MGLFNTPHKEEKKIKETIEANNFYDGIKCSIQKDTPPFNKITIYEFDENLKSEEVSQTAYELKSNNFDTIIQASDDGIIIEYATIDVNDLVIPFTNIVGAKEGTLPKELIITLIDNHKIIASITSINKDSIYGPKYVRDYVMSVINNLALGKQYEKIIHQDTTQGNSLKNGTSNTQVLTDNFGSPREWAREEVTKVENDLLPILGREGISKLTKTLETIVTAQGYEEAIEYLKYTINRVNYYNNKKRDYLIEAKLADSIYKSYVTDGISRLDKVNGRFMAAQNMKLDILIEQNTKIIQLLEEIAKK